ncbi:MAG: hypothetical protein M0Q42_02075 [Xanthomonadales bacterium]|nr:hypothetical protein [Xanthomonadales bacterium]
MTTIQLTLPDQLAEEAAKAGLLSSATLERWLRQQLKARHVEELFEAAERMHAVDDPPEMSPGALADAMRAPPRR